jgi:hypothetical protein
MDLSKLSANDRTAAYSAIVVVLAGIVSNWGGLMWLGVVMGIGVLLVLFLPQFSPGTSLPGSKGSLLVVAGVVAAACAVIEILRFVTYFTHTLDDWQTWAFAIALVASLVLAYVGWQTFQAEGGKLALGAAGGTSPAGQPANPVAAASPMPPQPPASPPVAAAPPAAPPQAVPPQAAEPPTASGDDEGVDPTAG